MNFDKLKQSWRSAVDENRFSRVAIAGLVIIVLIMTVALTQQKTAVTIIPPTLNNEAEIKASDATQSYKDAWALYLAQLLGNVTPGNVEMLKDAIGPLLAPKIYEDVMRVLNQQADMIQADKITQRFEPRNVIYERDTGKSFVEGYAYTKGSAGDEKRASRVYEFRIEIDRYAPVVSYIDTYSGRPKTQKMLERMNRKRN